MEVKPGYKQTKVGVIPAEWDVETGLEITTLIGKGGSPRWQGFNYANDGMLFVTSENVRDGFLDVSEPKYLPLAFHEKLKRTKLQKGDILINLVGASIGRSCQIICDLGEANVNQAVAVFRVKEKHSSPFIAFYFQAPATVGRILDMQVDVARPNVSLSDLRGFLIPLPSPPEQRAIAGALSDVDALLGALDQFIAKKRDLKQAAMQQLLTGQTRLPGFHGKWAVKSLASVCSMKSGQSITSANIDDFSKHPCYGGNGLRGFTSRFTHVGSYALIGRQGALCGNVLGVEGTFFASEHAVVVTAFAQTDIRWLTCVLAEMRLNRYSEASAQPGLSVAKVLNMDIKVPPTKAEQTAIAEVLTDLDAELAALEQRRAKTRALKQGMMQELLTGRVRLV